MTKTGTPSTSMQSPNISDSLKQSPDWKATNYSFSGLYNSAIYIIHFVCNCINKLLPNPESVKSMMHSLLHMPLKL